jgi:hypothetical protein
MEKEEAVPALIPIAKKTKNDRIPPEEIDAIKKGKIKNMYHLSLQTDSIFLQLKCHTLLDHF